MIASMSNDLRTSYARIGRSYPRPMPEMTTSKTPLARRIPPHLRVVAAVVAFLSALGLIGWFLAR